MSRSTGEIILSELISALRPIVIAADEIPPGSGINRLALEVGVDLNGLLSQEQIDEFSALIRNIYSTLKISINNPVSLTSQIPEILQNIKGFTKTLESLNINLPQNTDLGKTLLDYLIISYLETHYPFLFKIFVFGGLIQHDLISPGGNLPEYYHREIVWSQFSKILNIGNALKDVYHWGENNFDSNSFLARLSDILWTIGFPSVFRGSRSAGSDGIMDLFWSIEVGPVSIPLGLVIGYLPVTNDQLPGIYIAPNGGVAISTDMTFPGDWNFAIELNIGANSGYIIEIRPEGDIKINNIPDQPAVNWTFGTKLKLSSPTSEDKAFIIFGSAEGTRLETISTDLSIMARAGVDGGEIVLELNSHGSKLVITLEKADGFIGNIVPSSNLSFDFDFTLGFSTLNGLYFKGSSSLEINIPLHIDIGPLGISNICIKVQLTNSSDITVEMLTTFQINLGPMKAVAENLGILAFFDFTNSDNIGPFDPSFGFKPPNGVGLSMDTGVIKGGGYLFFDSDKGEYGGAIQLVFSDFLNLQAIGLITTKMPDGSKGFALLILITVEFNPGFQIGMGFAISGVGGLFGLNHSMNLDPMRDGVRDGSLQSIMFPVDVVANAPRILSDMRRFFPLEQGKFVIGPMIKITYGSPALLSITLGIIIEIKGNIAIVGVIKAALPTEKEPVLLLQVNFIGAIEFDKKRAWFFASIYNSKILTMTLEGEMAFLIGWGSDPAFLVTVGGFHPQFQPPPTPFSNIKRLSLSILNESTAKIQVQAYFAITSNSVQFGVQADLFFGLSECKVSGHLSFDALIQFNPFFFIIQIALSVAVSVGGMDLLAISLSISLQGPTPWKIAGKGKVSILFFEVSFNLEKQWGREDNATLPPVAIKNLIIDELKKKENWKALLPPSNTMSVSLKPADPDSTDIILYPLGQLQITQKVAPLSMDLKKFGSQKIADIKRIDLFDISDQAPPDNQPGNFVKTGDAKDKFAMAQFLNKEGLEKVKAPSYESKTSGILLSVPGNQIQTSKVIRRNVRYEQIIIDSKFKRTVNELVSIIPAFFIKLIKGSAISLSLKSKAQNKLKQPFDEKITMTSLNYYLVSVLNNQPVSGLGSFDTHSEASEAMRRAILENPSLKGQIQIIPEYEVNHAA